MEKHSLEERIEKLQKEVVKLRQTIQKDYVPFCKWWNTVKDAYADDFPSETIASFAWYSALEWLKETRGNYNDKGLHEIISIGQESTVNKLATWEERKNNG